MLSTSRLFYPVTNIDFVKSHVLDQSTLHNGICNCTDTFDHERQRSHEWRPVSLLHMCPRNEGVAPIPTQTATIILHRLPRLSQAHPCWKSHQSYRESVRNRRRSPNKRTTTWHSLQSSDTSKQDALLFSPWKLSSMTLSKKNTRTSHGRSSYEKTDTSHRAQDSDAQPATPED